VVLPRDRHGGAGTYIVAVHAPPFAARVAQAGGWVPVEDVGFALAAHASGMLTPEINLPAVDRLKQRLSNDEGGSQPSSPSKKEELGGGRRDNDWGGGGGGLSSEDGEAQAAGDRSREGEIGDRSKERESGDRSKERKSDEGGGVITHSSPQFMEDEDEDEADNFEALVIKIGSITKQRLDADSSADTITTQEGGLGSRGGTTIATLGYDMADPHLDMSLEPLELRPRHWDREEEEEGAVTGNGGGGGGCSYG